MSAVAAESVGLDDPRMGSEYAAARTFLSRLPDAPSAAARKRVREPQHGSNDSDFGVADQVAD